MNLPLQFLTRCIYFKQNISSFFMLCLKVCYSENASKPITTELKIFYKPNQCFNSLKFQIIYLIQRSFTRNTFRIIKQKFPSAYSFLVLFCSFLLWPSNGKKHIYQATVNTVYKSTRKCRSGKSFKTIKKPKVYPSFPQYFLTWCSGWIPNSCLPLFHLFLLPVLPFEVNTCFCHSYIYLCSAHI